jgi:hypothetical protein
MTMRSPIRKYALALFTCMTVLSLRAPAQGANPPPGLVGTWAGPGGAPFQFNGTGTFEVPYSPLQAQHAREARANPQLLKSNNHGSPALAGPAAMRPTIGARPTAPTAQAPRAPAGHGAGPAPAAAQSHPPQPTHPAQPAHPVAGAPSQNKPQPHPTPPPQKPHRS